MLSNAFQRLAQGSEVAVDDPSCMLNELLRSSVHENNTDQGASALDERKSLDDAPSHRAPLRAPSGRFSGMLRFFLLEVILVECEHFDSAFHAHPDLVSQHQIEQIVTVD